MAPKGKGKGSKKGGKKPSGPGSSNLTENKLVEEVDVFGVEEDKGKNKVKGEEDRVSEVSTPVDLQRLLEGMGLPASDVEKLVQESFPGATVVPESAKPDATPSHICETTETCPNPSLPS